MAFWRRRRLEATNRPSATFSGPPAELWAALVSPGSSAANVAATRIEAMSVPAVTRGLNVLASIATLPLIQLDPEGRQVRNPLLTQLDPDVPNVVTLAQTVGDLVLDAVAWWQVTATDFAGFPVAVRHLDADAVSVRPPSMPQDQTLPSGLDPRGPVVWVNGIEVPASAVIRFDSPNPGVLRVGGRAIRRAIALDRAAALYAEDPRPLDYFTDHEDADTLDDAEITDTLNQWVKIRTERATGYVPNNLVYKTVDSPSPADLQLVELQRQASLEIANLFGLDPEDLGLSTTSRTYMNHLDRRRDRINDVLAPYMRAISDRLSMGDVTRRGHRIAFDLDDYMKANPTERVAYYQAMVAMGVMDAAEIRAAEDLPPQVSGAGSTSNGGGNRSGNPLPRSVG